MVHREPAGLGEPRISRRVPAWEGEHRRRPSGSMRDGEYALLIGLSRQIALQRELDVVANNIANINTTGFKADGAVFEEYLHAGARDAAVRGADRRAELRAGPHDLARHEPGRDPADRQPARRRDRRRRLPRRADAGGERYTRNGALQINADGELVTSDGDQVLGDGGPIVLQHTDRDIVITKDGTITVREGASLNSDATRGKLRLVALRQPAAACARTAPAPSGRRTA